MCRGCFGEWCTFPGIFGISLFKGLSLEYTNTSPTLTLGMSPNLSSEIWNVFFGHLFNKTFISF